MRRVRLTSAVKTDFPYVCGDAGDILNLPDHSAFFVVNQKLGEYHGPEEAPGPSRAALEAEETALANAKAAASAGTLQKMDFNPGEKAEGATEGIKSDADPADIPETPSDEPKRPYGNAPKSDWIRYACAVDTEMTEERGETMTKADLMGKFGERL